MSNPATFDASRLSHETQVQTNDLEDEKANLSLIFDRFKDKITDFPKEKGWLGNDLCLYKGHWFPLNGLFSIWTVMAAQDTFQANLSDIYLATLPKCGTTWLKALTFSIVNRTRYNNNHLATHPLLISSPHDCLPYIENEVIKTKPTYTDENFPRLFATHMPYTLLPQSILDSRCRLVYMCRNPKDVLVSLFHFVCKLKGAHGAPTMEEVFEKFIKGVDVCAPYWDHVIGYYRASVEQPTRVLFLTYENMKMDTANNVKRLAEFLGFPFSKEEEAEGMVQEIVSLCDFKNLSETNKDGHTNRGLPRDVFFRKGKTGDWTNYLTNEMSKILDQITKEKFHGLDIEMCVNENNCTE